MRSKLARHAVFLLCIGLAGVACSDSPTEPEPFDVNDVVFAEELGIGVADLEETGSGLYYYDETVGEGPQPDEESVIQVHITLWLEDGTPVVDTRQDEPAEYDISNQNFIAGFEEGLFGMNEGGTRIMVLPPELAWGQAGNQGVPPNTGVVFRIELVSVTPPPE